MAKESMIGSSPYLFKGDRYSSHTLIAALLKQHARAFQGQSYHVLDVGCAAGFLHHFLPSPYFHLIGVERDPNLVDQARRHYQEVYQADLNQELALPLQHQPDCIVLADVLEHLSDPQSVLEHLLRQYAKPGTLIVVSLPNIAHLYIRLSLLFGRFNYTDRGILDRTHLRFYTLQTARQLCETCGIRVTSLQATPLPLPLVHPIFGEGQPLFMAHALSAFLSATFKSLLGYQFILGGIYEP